LPAGASSGGFRRSLRARPCVPRQTHWSARSTTAPCGLLPALWASSIDRRIATILASLQEPNFLLKIIPHVDGTPRICELVEYRLQEIALKGAWTGPAALDLTSHALAPLSELPVHEVVSAVHLVADLTLGLGRVVHDYLATPHPQTAKGKTYDYAK
jgi:hypothetical protein